MEGSVENELLNQDGLTIEEPKVQSLMREANMPPVVPEESVADQLRTAFATAKTQRTKDFRIPGYEPHHLVVTLRAIDDYVEMRQMIVGVVKKTRHLPKAQIAQQQIALGTETLIKAAVDSYVLKDDGTKVEIGKKLGLELYSYIFPPDGSGNYRPMTDAEAVNLLFPTGSSALMQVAAEYDMWQRGTSFEVEESLLGE